MNKRFQRFLSCILFIVVLLQGICIEGVEAQSIELVPENAYTLICDDYNAALKCIDSDEAVLSQPDSCTAEMIGIRNSAGISKVVSNYSTYRKTQKVDCYSFTADSDESSTSYNSFYKLLYTVQIPKICFSTVLLNYIHNKDGKK